MIERQKEKYGWEFLLMSIPHEIAHLNRSN